MTKIKITLKKIIPPKVINFSRKKIQSYVFNRSIKKFMSNPDSFINPNDTVIKNLIFGWGNQGYSAKNEYLNACINKALSTKGPVLECGSGLSTILLGIIAQKRGYKHYALEHHSGWSKKVQYILRKYSINSVKIITSPLKSYGKFDWYNIPINELKKSFPLVICDGPPAQTKGGRYGLLPLMREYMSNDCMIILDDAIRKEEVEIAKKWSKEFNCKYEIKGKDDPFIEISFN